MNSVLVITLKLPPPIPPAPRAESEKKEVQDTVSPPNPPAERADSGKEPASPTPPNPPAPEKKKKIVSSAEMIVPLTDEEMERHKQHLKRLEKVRTEEKMYYY